MSVDDLVIGGSILPEIRQSMRMRGRKPAASRLR
jgi:hypothetical protein